LEDRLPSRISAENRVRAGSKKAIWIIFEKFLRRSFMGANNAKRNDLLNERRTPWQENSGESKD
jgi:hypothetical protein